MEYKRKQVVSYDQIYGKAFVLETIYRCNQYRSIIKVCYYLSALISKNSIVSSRGIGGLYGRSVRCTSFVGSLI